MTCPVAIRRAAIALVALLMAILGGQSALARTITNTAHASWSGSSQTYSANSNTVTIGVSQLPASIDSFAGVPSSGNSLSFISPLCGGAAIGGGGASQGGLQSIPTRQSSAFHAGDRIYIRVNVPAANVNPTATDSIEIVLTSPRGDRETITIFETGLDTGVFAGAMQTMPVPPNVTPSDCRLSVGAGDKVRVSAVVIGQSAPVAQTQLDILADPFGLVFDSEDATPVEGAKVSLVDSATGAPAVVFAPDGVTRWPSTVYTGQTATDAAGNVYQLLPGEYRFPLAPPGTYRILVDPPAPYRTPSASTATQLAGLTRSDGTQLVLNGASWGGALTLAGSAPVQIDIPVDRPPVSISLTKTVSRQIAQPGEVVFYTVAAKNPDPLHARRSVTLVDLPSPKLRLRRDTVRVDGAPAPSAIDIAPDGSAMTVNLGMIAAGADKVVTYAMTVRPDATPGQAINRVETTDWRGDKSYASALVNVEGDTLTGRMTIIGRITDNGCGFLASHRGIPGVQVMLEDGSFAITDAEGRYHFDGVVPGTHVAAANETTLPDGGKLLNCGSSTREAGSASSRFVRGQGGSLAVANFHAVLPDGWASATGLTAGPDAGKISPLAGYAMHPVRPLTPGVPRIEVDESVYSDSFAADQDARTPAPLSVSARHTVQPLAPGAPRVEVDESIYSDSVAAGQVARAPNPAAESAKHTVQPLASGAAPVEIDEATFADRVSAGAETDWLARGDGPPEFLFPAIGHNPRAPAVRVVIRHKADQKVELFADGRPVEKVSFDGIKRAANGAFAVSIWRGIPLNGEITRLSARVLEADGRLATGLTRDVHFSSTAADVQLVPEKSHLVADGRTRPVIAVRVLDRQGNPVHAGISGDFSLGAPYESAEALDAMQSRALSGLGRSAPHWTVKGDDGIALIELAPTMVSGAVQLDFDFIDNKQKRHQSLEGWIVPGDIKWTLVGLAEGSVGARSVADEMERKGRFDSDLGDHARTAFYAKGRVLGKYLVTLAYDSAKQRDETRLLGAIDPRAYYTVFADGSDRRFDAASRNKLYVRLESRAFYAMFGDFQTGFNQTQLTRYQRTGTGARGEFHLGGIHAEAFATRIASAHRRDDIQGAGISGPYQLSSRAIIANSENIAIEVRDRFRSEKIVASRQLTRFVDYDLDLLAGTITFKQPILGRDVDLNPQFIVIDYEVDTNAASGELNAGLRADVTTAKGRLRIGATAVTDTGNGQRTEMGGLDLKARIGANTELRAEIAASHSALAGTDTAWLVEAEHHDRKLDLLAYARSMEQGYGVGQASGAESGRRKFGADARVILSEDLSVTASGWIDNSLTDAARRNAIQLRAEYRAQKTDFRAGISHFSDRLTDGRNASSTVLEGGISERFLNNRLEVDASSSVALGSDDSADLPSRHQLTMRYALSPAAKLTGSYEIASGSTVDARTARAGIELTPWRGARVTGGLGQQDIAEYGKRSFASFGLAQSFDVTSHLSLDGTVEANKVLGGFDASRVINPEHPLASGGHLGGNGSLTENFTAVTAGATWRANRWSVTMRGEWRDGEFAERKGATFGAIRQLGEGSMLGSGVTWTQAHGVDGTASEILTGALALAYRPADSAFATLTKVELRSDTATGAAGGFTAAAGGSALSGAGNLQSTRIIGSVSTNWSPAKRYRIDGNRENDGFVQRTEIGLFGAVRYNLDRGQDLDLLGTSLFGGLDARIGIGERLEIGGTATVRSNLSDHTTSFAAGPEIGVVPARDVLLSVGYNIAGFRDRDFSAARTTDKGFFATLRMKFDTSTLGWLGLGR